MTINLSDHTHLAWTVRDRLDFSQKADVSDLVKTLFAAMANGEKIMAIKAFRSLTGEGLKDSKDAVESVMRSVAPKPTCEDNEYTYGHYVFVRCADYESWRCEESDSTLGYARVRANDAVDHLTDGETVFIMKSVARSVTTTTMKDV